MKTIPALLVMSILGCQLQAQVSFKLSSSPGVGSAPNTVAAADVNGDGKLDLISANYYGDTLSVLTNSGSGGFVLSGTYGVGTNPTKVIAADVNGDGKVDLISANAWDGTLSVLTNNGSGGFVLSGTYAGGDGSTWVAAADVNGDGKVDLICANWASGGGNTLTVLTNNGSGGFVLAATPVVGNGPYAVTVADVNGDGKVDLICANRGSGGGNTLTVLTNNGNGGFVLASSPVVGYGVIDVAAADVNGDGKTDLISANYHDKTLSILTNNGIGSFVFVTNLNVANNPNSVTAADVNGDSELDLISPNVGNTVAIFTNATPFPQTGPLSPIATGIATMQNGFVVGVTVTYGGFGYTNTPYVQLIGGGGSGAQAVVAVSNGVVTAIQVLNAGSGYTSVPQVVIDPPFVPSPVLGIAPMSLLNFSNLTVGGAYQLQQSVQYYWVNLPVSFTASNTLFTQMVAGAVGSVAYRLALNPVPAQAFATPQVVNGFVVGATLTSGGSGYFTSPAVIIIGRGGVGAGAYSSITAGVVTSITITNAGYGYTNSVTMQIAPPPAAAVFPAVQPVMRVDSANLAPYYNYQIQFKPDFAAQWMNWGSGLFSPTGITNSQYMFITNSFGCFRLQYVP